ncbi:hypothetical protein EIP91_002400 [Steccherinum ochraceum]|uniref:Uncharacterized protein n=1 Tax=Steccherinum ochraceum TaxID=92696 RepID=A0A4R0RS57_9APHY|nr:hypothetical protein EIP91_002400 [Steccherinum ochraceum]
MISFTPAHWETTTIALPTSLSAGKDSHLVRFKASFGSRQEFEQAQRDGVRVEMWTNLETVGGPAGGVWRAIAFEYPVRSNASGADADAGDVISFLPDESFGGPQNTEAAVFLDVHIPGDIFSYFEHPRYSFTYRLVYRSGHIEWLGAFGHDGVLAFEQRDTRVTLNHDSQISTTGGGYIVESEAKRVIGVGRLSNALLWERWSFGGNGPSFSRSHITSPSGCIILTPSPAPGIHNFTPEALQPMILTAGPDGSSLSISESGDITFHPAAEASYHPAGFTTVGARMLAMGKDSNLLDYDASSDTMVVTSTTSPGETQMSPVALSFVPLGPRPQGAAHIDVKVNSEKLAGVFPGSDIVLYQKTPAQKFKVVPTSDRKEECISIRVKASGDQIFVAPLHDLSALTSPGESDVVRAVDIWQVAVVSPHVAAQVVSEVHDVASVFPTPPPSPPLRSSGLGHPFDSAPSIDSVLASIAEEDEVAEVAEEEAPSEAASPTISPSSTADQDVKEALLSPAPSSIFDVPRYVSSQIFDAYPEKHNGNESLAPMNTLLQLTVVSFIQALFGSAFGMLAFVLAMFGVKVSLPAVGAKTQETMMVYDEDDEDEAQEVDVKATSVTAAESETDLRSERDDEVLSEGTAFDDEKTPCASPVLSSTTDHKEVPALDIQKPSTQPTSRSSYLTVALSPESNTVQVLVTPPKTVDLSLPTHLQLSIDGKAPSNLIWNAVDSSSYIAELRGETPLGGELKISIEV